MRDITTPWATLEWPDEWREDYEKEIWDDVTVQEGGTAINIGGHYGFYATKMAREAGPYGKVIAFEPNPTNRRILENNLARNQLSATIYDCAVSDYEGVGKLFTYGQEAGDSGKNFLRGAFKEQAYEYGYTLGQPAPKPQWDTEVKVTTLDKIVDKLHKIDLIMMDVEGAELKVIEGGKHILINNNPRIVIEVHFHLEDALKQLLAPLGYSMTKYYTEVTYSPNAFIVFEKEQK
jgi:FkbM family methyltransferase